jgi:hypothetical protein
MAIPNKLTTAGSGMNRTATSMTNPEISGTAKNTDEEICRRGGVARNRRRHSFGISCALQLRGYTGGVAIPLAHFVGVGHRPPSKLARPNRGAGLGLPILRSAEFYRYSFTRFVQASRGLVRQPIVFDIGPPTVYRVQLWGI